MLKLAKAMPDPFYVKCGCMDARTVFSKTLPTPPFVPGSVAFSAWYAVKYHLKPQLADPEQTARENEDLKKRLNKLRAATAARS